jgi:phosphatidate cytidylyltransferase
MNANTKFMYLMAVVMGILVIASIIGAILHTRVKGDSGRAVVLNLNARIRAWWGMIAIFAVAFWLGPIATLVLFAIVSFFALREFVTLTPTRPGDHRALAVAFFVMIPLQYYTIGIAYYSLFSLMIPVYGFLLLPSLSTLTQDTEHFLERSAKIQWAVMITIYCISSAPALLMLKIPDYEGQSALLLFYLLLIVQLSDVMQYVVGKLFGKTKLAPVISPSKTVEGLIGGGAIAVVVDHAVFPAGCGLHVGGNRRCRRAGRTGPVGSQAQPGRQGLGHHDRRPRRYAGSHGLGQLRGAGVLPPGAVFLHLRARLQ